MEATVVSDERVGKVIVMERYRLQFFVQAQNLTNRANDVGYSGTMTSLFFRQPTSVASTRRVETGINFSF